MRAAVLHGPGDIRVEDRPEPTIADPTDAVIKLTTTCVCGSDLWPCRGVVETAEPHPIGHEYVGIVEQIGAGWFGAKAAEAGPGKTVAVVGDGAVGLLAILAVSERGDAGVERIRELTNGLGAHSVIEAVGTQESFQQAIRATRPGGHLGFVGVGHEVPITGIELFFSEIHVHGGPAPVREYLPHLVDLIMRDEIDPGKVFDLEVSLEDIAEGYAAMDERRAIKALVRL